MGVSSSIYAAVIFPMIPIVVSEKVLGTAYGACTSTMNIGNSLGPILTGALTFKENKADAYFWVNISMAIICSFGIISSFILMVFNKVYLKGILQVPSYNVPVDFSKRASTLDESYHTRLIEDQDQEQNS